MHNIVVGFIFDRAMPRTRRAAANKGASEDTPSTPPPPPPKLPRGRSRTDPASTVPIPSEDPPTATGMLTMASLKQQHANLKLQLELKKMEREATQQALALASQRASNQAPPTPRQAGKRSTAASADDDSGKLARPAAKRSKQVADHFDAVEEGVKTKLPAAKRSTPEVVDKSDDEEEDDCAALMSHALREMYDYELSAPVDRDTGDVLRPFLIAGATVNKKVKAKIWNFEYIELSLLASNDAFRPNKPDMNVDYDKGEVSQISLTSSKARKATNFFDWLRWFVKYAAIYCQKHSSDSPSLLSYILIILQLNTDHSCWREYDEAFRRIREISQLPWHLKDAHVLSQANEAFKNHNNSTNNSTRRSNPQTRNGNSKPSKNKHCFDFQGLAGCKKAVCPYPHVCRICAGSNHGAHRCYKAKPNTKPAPSAAQGKRQ